MSIQYKVEENQLTTPPSHSIRFVPRGSVGRAEIAADIALRHPNFSKSDILTILKAEDEAIMARLLNGEQVTKEGCCTWFPSFAGRLDNPDAPLPPLMDCLRLNVRVSPPFVEDFCQNAQVARLAATEKAPVITAAEDTVLGLRDVLRSDGMLRISGSNLAFDRSDPVSRCLIEGTRSGSAVQSRIGTANNSEIVLMPDVPSQPDPWNNEYRLSVTTRYTTHGSPRTGIYKHLLRTPLPIPNFGPGVEIGILTGAAENPYVHVTGGTASGEATLRIQVILDLQADCLRFNLLDMTEGGAAGAVVNTTANGALTLPGFVGSTIMTLDISVLQYAALKDLLRNTYNCRLVDVLVIT